MTDFRPHFPWSETQLRERVQTAVTHYWTSRTGQATQQRTGGITDAGSRGEVTGGQHLNTFVALFCDLIRKAGFTAEEIRFKIGVELPGFYRPTKKWDVVVIRNGRLCAAIELKWASPG